MRKSAFLAGAMVLPLAAPAFAQDHDMRPDHGMMAMPIDEAESTDGTAHRDHDDAMATVFAEGSGTARLPAEGAEGHGIMLADGDWPVMAHGFASAQYTDHGGPRGDDKAYVTSMGMVMAETRPEWGRVQLKSMMSLEPLMDARGYPNLLATGETADGEPLVDRQHPHDLFMELAGRVDVNIGADSSLFVYGGPVGEPALGPSAFMHRPSAANNPEPPITHHWFDSTHITYGVVTTGISTPTWQVEASAFRGAEPDEERWDIETPKLDSWSLRATLTPTPRWALQASYAQIKEPEALHPGEDENRFTASAQYGDNRLNAMIAFSVKDRSPGDRLTAWLAEADYALTDSFSLFGRYENVANDELFPDHADPLHDRAFRVAKLQLGGAKDVPLTNWSSLTFGGSIGVYGVPSTIQLAYGDRPVGFTLFTRVNFGH